MRLPSLQFVVRSAEQSARRFPFVLSAGFLAAFAGGVLSAVENTSSYRLMLTAMLGLPLLFALTVLAEQRPKMAAMRWLLPALGAGVLVTFWFVWTAWPSPIKVLRYLQLALAFHLFVAFAPYIGSARPNGFWQYNKVLFLRFLTAWLYSAVLYAGLAIAMLAVDKLFGVHIAGSMYNRLWMLIAFVFHTWFFLGGIPDNLASLDQRTDYPAGLRVFTQYVLVPIVALYLTILTLYLAKVLYTRQWPNGWIGYLVSSVATVGILSWLLVYPLEERKEYTWVKTFTRGFYLVLMPAIAMLWLAVYKRVAEYGITEKRYFLIVLSVWLAGVALYYTLTRSRNIKLIPASLCAVTLLTFAGPTGAYSVSQASQTKRLEAILVRNGLLVNGRLHATTQAVTLADRKEIGGSLVYLLETHANAVTPWLSDSLRKALPGPSALSSQYSAGITAKSIMATLNVEYVEPGWNGPTDYFSYTQQLPHDAVRIDGYTHAVRVAYWNGTDSVSVDTNVWLRISPDSSALRVTQAGAVLVEIPLQAVVDSASAYQRVHGNMALPPEIMRVQATNGSASALLCLTSLSGWKRAGGPKLTGFGGEIFLKLK